MELGAWLAGFSNFFAALITDPALADELLDRALEIKLRFWEAVLPEVGDYVDIISESEDLGVQDRLMVSPRIFRAHIKPRLRAAHPGHQGPRSEGQGAPAFRRLHRPDLARPDRDRGGHSHPCRSQQPGWRHRLLEARVRARLVFWGPLIPSTCCPSAAPAEVEAEVQRRIDDLAPAEAT